MTCRDIIEFLNEYAAGTVPADERIVFESHLAVCPPCVAYLKNYQTTVQLEQAAFREQEATPAPLPQELVAAILAARKANA